MCVEGSIPRPPHLYYFSQSSPMHTWCIYPRWVCKSWEASGKLLLHLWNKFNSTVAISGWLYFHSCKTNTPTNILLSLILVHQRGYFELYWRVVLYCDIFTSTFICIINDLMCVSFERLIFPDLFSESVLFYIHAERFASAIPAIWCHNQACDASC